ncbi:MAG: hypothetical protein KatS3mg102_1646 [Planctomycetota bacterium]|nr:MAG: hypothetical protein KatS3mg102_1646 [Planctomycetota bacterium]
MGVVQHSTVRVRFRPPPATREALEAATALMDGILRELIQQLRRHAPDPEAFEGSLRFSWYALPHANPAHRGVYCLDVHGRHEVAVLREAADAMRRLVAERNYPHFALEIGVDQG